MSDSIESKKTYDDEEISLLDLFAVLVRYRKLVVWGTVVVTILAGLWLFAVPKILPDLANEKAEVTYTVNIVAFPLKISEKLPDKQVTPLNLASNEMVRLPFLVKEFKQYSVFYDDKMSDFDFNSTVQQMVSKKDFDVKKSAIGNCFDVVMNIDIADLDEATDMMTHMVSDIDADIQAYFMPILTTMKENAETSIEKSLSLSTGNNDLSSLQELQDLSVELDKYLASFSSFLTLGDAPFVVPAAKGRAKKLVIFCIAAFFVFICAAFCKNAIENVKKDPEASKLIADAWKEGK